MSSAELKLSETVDSLRKDIVIYTWILSGTKGPGVPVIPTKHIDKNLSVAQHIVALLTTGTPSSTSKAGNRHSDTTAARVLAATVSHLPNRNVTRVVLTRNTFYKDSPATMQVKAVEASQNVTDVLENWYTRP